MDRPKLLNAGELKQILSGPPLISGDLPGTGGIIKAVPEHFQVEEMLPYAPCGEGEHVFVTLRRAGWNTVDVAAALGEALGIRGPDIGWGGRKDKHAVTTQTFSLRLPMDMPRSRIESSLATLPFDILALERHRNKLKTGHVAGNRFRIVVSQVAPPAAEYAQAIVLRLKDCGVPNYYGEQRFGIELRNLDRAVALPGRGKPVGRKDAFMVSVLQSALFNCWLIARLERGEFNTLLPGDVARKTDTGGLFIVDDIDEAARRFQSGLISYTGPIYGHKMMAAAGRAGEYEDAVLQRFGLNLAGFKHLRITDLGMEKGQTPVTDDNVMVTAKAASALLF